LHRMLEQTHNGIRQPHFRPPSPTGSRLGSHSFAGSFCHQRYKRRLQAGIAYRLLEFHRYPRDGANHKTTGAIV
jgi:hypothetical protein